MRASDTSVRFALATCITLINQVLATTRVGNLTMKETSKNIEHVCLLRHFASLGPGGAPLEVIPVNTAPRQGDFQGFMRIRLIAFVSLLVCIEKGFHGQQ